MLIIFEIDGPVDIPIKQTNKFPSEAYALAFLRRRQRDGRQFAASVTRVEQARQTTKQIDRRPTTEDRKRCMTSRDRDRDRDDRDRHVIERERETHADAASAATAANLQRRGQRAAAEEAEFVSWSSFPHEPLPGELEYHFQCT